LPSSLVPMSLDLSGQSVNFSLKRTVSMHELILPTTVQAGRASTTISSGLPRAGLVLQAL